MMKNTQHPALTVMSTVLFNFHTSCGTPVARGVRVLAIADLHRAIGCYLRTGLWPASARGLRRPGARHWQRNANRMYTPKTMRSVASEYTGVGYRQSRMGLERAYADLGGILAPEIAPFTLAL